MKEFKKVPVVTPQRSRTSSKINQTLFLFFLLFSISVPALAFQAKSDKKVDRIKLELLTDSIAKEIINPQEVPGMSVAVAKNGEIIFRKNYGLADVEMNTKVNDSTVFGLASITKQYTAATIMRLIENGRITLDDPLTKFLPDYSTQGHNVTIHHLLSHTAGMKDYGLRNEKLPGWYGLELSSPKMMELWANRPFDNKPGENFDYSNWGYYLLGQIIEKVTGTSWTAYAEPELLKPLGLNNTLFAHQLRIVPGRAKGYLHQKDSLINVPYRNIETFSAGGGLSSTIEDVVKWTHLLHSGKVISAESLKKMTTPTVLKNGKTVGYGYGLYINELRGHKKIYHGGTFGFGTYVSHYPEENLTIAVLTNSTKGRDRAAQLEELLATAALDIKIKELALTAEDINRYAGVYSYQSTPTQTRELKIFGEDGNLYAQISDNRPFLLRSQGNNEFIPDAKGITNINFEVIGDKAEKLTIHEGAWEVTEGKRKTINN